MTEVENNIYEIRVIKPKGADDSWSETPEASDSREVSGFQDSKFFNCNLLAPIIHGYRPQGGKVQLTIFNSTDQIVTFQDLEEILLDPDNFTVLKDGDLMVKGDALKLIGHIVTEEVPEYRAMLRGEDGKWKPLKSRNLVVDPLTGAENFVEKEVIRNTITYFVHKHESELARSIRERRRAKKFQLTIPEITAEPGEESEGVSTEVEGNAPAKPASPTAPVASKAMPEGATKKDKKGEWWIDDKGKRIAPIAK